MLHGYFVVAAANLNSHSVIFKPCVRLGLAGELTNSSRQPEVGRNYSGPDRSAETFWSLYMNPAAGGNVSVMAFSVSSIPVDQTLNDNGSRIKAWLPGVDWKPTPNTVLASVILLPRDVRST